MSGLRNLRSWLTDSGWRASPETIRRLLRYYQPLTNKIFLENAPIFLGSQWEKMYFADCWKHPLITTEKFWTQSKHLNMRRINGSYLGFGVPHPLMRAKQRVIQNVIEQVSKNQKGYLGWHRWGYRPTGSSYSWILPLKGSSSAHCQLRYVSFGAFRRGKGRKI